MRAHQRARTGARRAQPMVAAEPLLEPRLREAARVRRDFQMLELIYDLEHSDCADPTQPAVVNVLDRLFASLHSAHSVWQRRAWFARLVRERLERSSRPVRVLDIACGGGRHPPGVIGGPPPSTLLGPKP